MHAKSLMAGCGIAQTLARALFAQTARTFGAFVIMAEVCNKPAVRNQCHNRRATRFYTLTLTTCRPASTWQSLQINFVPSHNPIIRKRLHVGAKTVPCAGDHYHCTVSGSDLRGCQTNHVNRDIGIALDCLGSSTSRLGQQLKACQSVLQS